MRAYSSSLRPMEEYTSLVMAAIGRSISFRSVLRWVTVASLVPVSFGCGPRFSYQGEWKGTQSIQAKPGADPEIVASYQKVTLSVQPSGQFKLRLETFDYEGTLQVDGDSATLRPERFQGVRIERQPESLQIQATLTPNPDGSITLKVNSRDPIVLRRPSA